MTWFNNLNLRWKLFAAFGIVLGLMGVLAWQSTSSLSGVGGRLDRIYQENLLGVQYSLETNGYMAESGRDEKRALLTSDESQRRPIVAQTREGMAAAQESMKNYRATLASDADREQWAVVEAKVMKVIEARTGVLDLVDAGDIEGAMRAASAMTADVTDMNKTLRDTADFNVQLAAESKASATAARGDAERMLLILTIVAIMAGAAIAWGLARSVAGAVNKVRVAASGIAEGDVDQHLDLDQSDEVGEMARSFQSMMVYLNEMAANAESVAAGDLTVQVRPRGPKDKLGNALETMVTSLRGIISGVQQSAQSITSGSDQLRESSDQMAAATSQIAVAINEVTQSSVTLAGLSQESAREIEKVAAGSQQVAAAAQENSAAAVGSRDEATRMGERITLVARASEEVASAAEESRRAAERGGEAVAQAVSSMEAIAGAVARASDTVNHLGEYGQQIGDIVKAIDEIAAQTNLLALNAAIEAARAGEQGRGFAVVAENVRSLAERSSDATKEIAALIGKVQAGTRQAVDVMAAGVEDVERGREITGEAGDSLRAIMESVAQSALRMQTIATDVQGLAAGADRIVDSATAIAASATESATGASDMAAATSRVTDAVMQVSATSEQTSASAEEVSASTEELSAQSEELAATATQLKDLAADLNAAASRFRLA
ncbi:MAG: MCP four helix bundle domain-containing protein [Dehalococcoidia bacterium]|nr:MCP four helix bundle domain-containing protein [Dehalococcoidia bacterium]